MKTTCYTVAGFTFRVTADSEIMAQMPSFRPFLSAEDSEMLFSVSVSSLSDPSFPLLSATPDEEVCNDFGRIRMYRDGEGYLFETSFGDSELSHLMRVSVGFTSAAISLNPLDPYGINALSSMLHILFSMVILPHGGIMTHASCVTLDGTGFMFLGRSGTGKSTHASLWLNSFGGCSLLNDDNPVVRIHNGGIRVYGSPWSGKTPCYRNLSFPLGGIARLEQAPVNHFLPLTDAEAFAAVLPSCSVIRSDHSLTESLYQSIITLCETVSIGLLRCRADREAALMCRAGLCSNS